MSSTTTLRSVFGPHAPPRRGSKGNPVSGHLRIGLAAAACVAGIFAIAAPLAGNPARRLLLLDDQLTVGDDFEMPSQRASELLPSNQWVAVDTIDVDATPVIKMPALDVRGDTTP